LSHDSDANRSHVAQIQSQKSTRAIDEADDLSRPWGENEERVDDSVPLFAHESGQYDVVWPEHDLSQDHNPGSVEYDIEVDLTDPNVEEMPTDTEGIMETIQRIESNLEEDVTDVSMAPPSPVLPPRKSISLSDQYKGYKVSDDQGMKPVMIHVSEQREEPEESRDSAKGARPVSSLSSILEQPAQELEPTLATVVSVPDTDMDVGTDANAAGGEHSVTESTQADNNPNGAVEALHDSDNEPTETTPLLSTRDLSSPEQLKRRNHSAQGQRAATPSSLHGIRDAKDGSWLATFIHLVFVEWIGGLLDRITRLCGGRQKT
jgi:hypothetical protein